MAPLLLPLINLHTYAQAPRGLNPKALSYIGSTFAVVTPGDVDIALTHLQNTASLFTTSLEVSTELSIDDVVALLDAGATQVFVTNQQLESLKAIDNLDTSRIGLIVDGKLTGEVVARSIFLKTPDQNLGPAMEWLGTHGDDVKVYLPITERSSASEVVNLLKASKDTVVPIISAQLLTVDATVETGLIPVADLLLANASSDRPDGLLSTLVTDERGVALGLVYSSKESVTESLRTGRGVYQSRKRGLWYKGESSGDTQELIQLAFDCDQDCLLFIVRQKGRGFCHLGTATCFGAYKGLARLQQTLVNRKSSAPAGSYTARLFNDPELLKAKILEEANELCDAKSKDEVAFEAADLFYFALTKCIAAGVTLENVEKNLDLKSTKVKRRKGDAKPLFAAKVSPVSQNAPVAAASTSAPTKEEIKEAASVPKSKDDPAGTKNGRIQMTRYYTSRSSQSDVQEALQRPSQRSTEKIMSIVNPIISDVRNRGDAALLEYTHKFEKAVSLTSPVIKAPYPDSMMQLSPETIEAIDISYENIRRFHAAQKDEKPLQVETMPGVICSRFSRPIERVGLYVPGGTAVLPSTALMLGVPAMVAGCKTIVIASPPRSDGSVTPEIVYVAKKVGAESIVLAGGAQAVAALAYGTESVSKVDKILGPGNQFVTAAKMVVSNDTTAGVSIDMPAGPSEVLVVADKTANPAFVAADLLSQAEHGVDSQVVCIAVGLDDEQVQAIEDEVHKQAMALPRVDIVRGAIDHSVTLVVADIEEAMNLSNQYAPEHLILQVQDAEKVASLVQNAGSVFIGQWTPESVGDYSAGVNHALPTYGYAKQYSGVNLGSYLKHITSSNLTAEGLKNVGTAVMRLAAVEELEAHRRAVSIRLAHMEKSAA